MERGRNAERNEGRLNFGMTHVVNACSSDLGMNWDAFWLSIAGFDIRDKQPRTSRKCDII
jgi:hypothetical protein